MPEIQAHLADGTILHFPEGTPDDVVRATAKRLSSGIPDKPPAGSDQALGYPGIPAPGATASQVVDAGRPFSIPVAVSAGTQTFAATPGPPIVKALAGAGMGAATYLGADTALQKVRNMLSGSSEEPSVANSAKQLAINELGGKVLGVVGRGANAGLGKISKAVSSLLPGINSSLTPEQEELSKLSPTFSQYFENKPIPKTLEDLFASSAKNKALKNSGKLADAAINQEAQDVSGRAASVMNPNDLAARVRQNDLTNSFNDTFREADKQAVNAKLIAKGNTIQLPGNLADAPEVDKIARSLTGQPFSSLNSQAQQTVLQTAQKLGIQPPVNPPIEGPIQLKSTLEKANKIFSDAQGSILEAPDEEKAAANHAYKLLKSTNAKFDPKTGDLISADPIPFVETWQQKQALDDLSGWGKVRGTLTTSERNFRALASNMNDDIDSAIAKWPNGAKQAQRAWQNAKDAVSQRNALFYTEGSSNKLGDLIHDVDSPIPAIDSILGDRDQLQRALNTGDIRFSSGTVSSSNIRGDLQAYNFIKLREGAKKLDPADVNGGLILNGDRMYQDWKDLRSPRNTVLYSAEQRGNYDQLYKNIAAVQQKQSQLGSYLSKVYLVKGAIAAAPALLGLATHGAGTAGEIAGVEIGAMALARLMAKPDTARIMVAAAAGQPLSMSEQMAARKLTAGLQGVTIALTGKDGNREEGSFNKEGEFQPTAGTPSK